MPRTPTLRSLFTPFFVIFIILGVLLSIGGTEAQSGDYGNFEATTTGYVPICIGTIESDTLTRCPYVEAMSAFAVPSGAPFSTFDSLTVSMAKDFFLGGADYTFEVSLGNFIPVGAGTPPSSAEFDLVQYQGYEMPAPGPLTTDFTVTRADLTRGLVFVPGQQYAVRVSIWMPDFVFAGWRRSDTPPSGFFDYIGTYARIPQTGGTLRLISDHPVLNIELSPPISLSPSTVNVTEGGSSALATFSFNAALSASVTMSVSAGPQCELSSDNVNFAASTIVQFPAGNASTAALYVRGVDDGVVEGAHSCVVTTLDTSPSFGTSNLPIPGDQIPDLTINITDNDTGNAPSGITLTESGGNTAVAEGGATDSFSLRLNSEPTAPVQIEMLTNLQCTVLPTSLTFSTSSALMPQNITVRAVNDTVFEQNPHICAISFNVTSGDSRYNGRVIPILNVSVGDNDPASTPEFVIAQTGGSTIVSEAGGTDSYTIRMTAPPTGGSVSLAISGDGQCDVSPGVMSFDAGNFSTPQTITVTAIDDAVAEGNHTCTIFYDTIIGNENANNTIVTVLDDDAAGFTVLESGGSTNVTEGGATDTITARLNTAPGQTVRLALATDGQCAVSPDSLSFTSANYATPQTVTVSAANDGVFEPSPHPCTIYYDVITFDSAYINAEVFNTIVNVNDYAPSPPPTAGVTVTQREGSTAVAEGGATDSFSLRLNSAPAASVQVAISTDAQCTAAPTTLTFDNSSYAADQNVTITAVDDTAEESTPHICAINFTVTSADGDYSGTVVAGVTVNVTDNDTPPPPPPPTAGVTVTESGGTTQVSEGGATDTIALRLNSAPINTVTIDITTDGQCAVAPASLDFDNTNFATDQAMTISADDDGVTEASPHACIISYTVTSTDGAYNALAVGDTTVDVTDAGASPPPPPGGGGVPPVPPPPTPPPTPLCEEHNFSDGGVVRTGIADDLRSAINCRVLYQNGAPTSWLGSSLYTSGSIGSEGVLALGGMQAIDIFSPSGMTSFNAGQVFCLRGEGYLIWLAARNAPRRAEIIGSYRVPEFPGFTCATLFEPGTLVLVSQLPEGVSAP